MSDTVLLLWKHRCFHFVSVPSATPTDVRATLSSDTLFFTWSSPECLQQNARIVGYRVELSSPQNQTVSSVRAEWFVVSDLLPGMNYSFRVAAVNTVGMGSFTDLVFVATEETGKS